MDTVHGLLQGMAEGMLGDPKLEVADVASATLSGMLKVAPDAAAAADRVRFLDAASVASSSRRKARRRGASSAGGGAGEQFWVQPACSVALSTNSTCRRFGWITLKGCNLGEAPAVCRASGPVRQPCAGRFLTVCQTIAGLTGCRHLSCRPGGGGGGAARGGAGAAGGGGHCALHRAALAAGRAVGPGGRCLCAPAHRQGVARTREVTASKLLRCGALDNCFAAAPHSVTLSTACSAWLVRAWYSWSWSLVICMHIASTR